MRGSWADLGMRGDGCECRRDDECDKPKKAGDCDRECDVFM